MIELNWNDILLVIAVLVFIWSSWGLALDP